MCTSTAYATCTIYALLVHMHHLYAVGRRCGLYTRDTRAFDGGGGGLGIFATTPKPVFSLPSLPDRFV